MTNIGWLIFNSGIKHIYIEKYKILKIQASLK